MLPDMKPQEILDHNDSGDLWPMLDDAAFSDLQSAYANALAVRGLRIARGEVPAGYKVGFTNRTIWSRYNVYAPIWGLVWTRRFPIARVLATCHSLICANRALNPRPCSASGQRHGAMPLSTTCSMRWVGWRQVSKSFSHTRQAGSSLHRKP